MRMIHDNKQRELTQLLRNPLFSQLTDFLYENQNVTLRQLTQQFSEKGFIKFLESCIELVESKLQNMEYGDEVLRMIKMNESYE